MKILFSVQGGEHNEDAENMKNRISFISFNELTKIYAAGTKTRYAHIFVNIIINWKKYHNYHRYITDYV